MENRNRQYRRESYIDGNVVRQPERAPERRRQYEEKSPEQLRKERMRRNAARQNRQRAMAMSRGYVAFLVQPLSVAWYVAYFYICSLM